MRVATLQAEFFAIPNARGMMRGNQGEGEVTSSYESPPAQTSPEIHVPSTGAVNV
jgi:hypothetical protein